MKQAELQSIMQRIRAGDAESFAALFAKHAIASGDKVHATAGIYTNGVMKLGAVKYRLVVPAGVTVTLDLHVAAARPLRRDTP